MTKTKCKYCWAKHTPGTNGVCDCPCHNPAPEPAEEEKVNINGVDFKKTGEDQFGFNTYSPSENEGWRERFKEFYESLRGGVVDINEKEFEKFLAQEIKEAEERGYADATKFWTDLVKDNSITNPAIAQARQETLAEIQKFVEGVKRLTGIATNPDEVIKEFKEIILSYLADKMNQTK